MAAMEPRIVLVDRDGNELVLRQQPGTVMPCNVVGLGIFPDGTPILYVLIHKDLNQMTPRDEWVPGARCPR